MLGASLASARLTASSGFSSGLASGDDEPWVGDEGEATWGGVVAGCSLAISGDDAGAGVAAAPGEGAGAGIDSGGFVGLRAVPLSLSTRSSTALVSLSLCTRPSTSFRLGLS